MTEDSDVKQIDISKLQHADDLCKVEDIILKISYPINGQPKAAYRLTHNPLEEEDFIPSAYLNGEGYNPSKEELNALSEEKRKKFATARAVSVYETEASAEKQAKRLAKKIEDKNRHEDADLFKKEHGYITKICITEDSGVITKAHRTTKHFNLFSYEGVDVRSLKDETYTPKRIDYDNNG